MLHSGKAHGPLEQPENETGRAGSGGHLSRSVRREGRTEYQRAGSTGSEAPKRLNFHSLAPCLN